MKTQKFVQWLEKNKIEYKVGARVIETPLGYVYIHKHAIMGIESIEDGFDYSDLKLIIKMAKYALTPIKKRGTL